MSGWGLSCADWRERLREGRPLVPELPLDREAAEKAINFIGLGAVLIGIGYTYRRLQPLQPKRESTS